MKININNISKIYSETTIFDECNFEIVLKEKVAIVGENGSGKSTLLKMIASLENYQEGNIFIPKGIKIGYLKQEFDRFDGSSSEYIMSEFKELTLIEKRMNEAADSLSNTDDLEKAMNRYANLQEEFERLGGYSIENDIDRIATGLNIQSMLNQQYNTLSGGEKTRIELVKLLVSDADVLCLDEPTNHLDFVGIEWLENYCKGLDKTIIVVSHDRAFLNNVVNVYHEIEDGQIVTYRGDYESFRKQKQVRFEHLVNDYKVQQEKIKKIKLAIRRYRQWGHEGDNEDFFRKAKMLEKRLERIETLPKPEELSNKLNLKFEVKNRSGKDVLVLKDLAIGYDDFLQIDLNLKITFRERWAIIGENGAGKSTLIKTILNEVEPLAGEVIIGSNVKIGYLAQQHTFYDESERILNYTINSLNVSEFVARTTLAHFGFYQNDVYKIMSQLSGGEKIRIRLMVMMYSEANFLILDEPTNHLDIQSCEILEKVLNEYDGTLLIVSHDRYFLNALNTKTFKIESQKEN